MEGAEEGPVATEPVAIAPEGVALEGELVPVVGLEELEARQVVAVLFERPPVVAEEEPWAKHWLWRPVDHLRA